VKLVVAIVKADGYGMKKGTFENNLKNPNWLLIFCIRCSQRFKVFSNYQIEFAWSPFTKMGNSNQTLETP